MSDIIQGLWIGDSLSKMEQLSIKSFLDNGHEYHLYTYGDVKNIPKGTIIKDGNEIVSKNEIYTYKNGSYSAFSNLFRFTMLYKKGGYWADTDLVCVKKIDIDNPYVFSSEPIDNYSKNTVNAGLIKIPKNSDVALEAIKIQKRHKQEILSGNMSWGSGPKTISEIVTKFSLEKYVLNWRAICSCAYYDFNTIINIPKKDIIINNKGYIKYYAKFIKNLVLSKDVSYNKNIIFSMKDIPNEMYAIHLWNEVWRQNNIDKNSKFDENCLYEQLKLKYNI